MTYLILAAIFLAALLWRERARDERTVQLVSQLLENHNLARESWDAERTMLLNRIEAPGTIQLPYANPLEGPQVEPPEPDQYEMVGAIENGRPDDG